MNKPLGYYTPHTANDGSIFDDMETLYGSHFEQISLADKFDLISRITFTLRNLTPPSQRNEGKVQSLYSRIRNVDISTQISFLKFLIDNCNQHTQMNAEEIPQPDPDWDYYETWQLLHHMKSVAEAGIALIADKKNADSETDAKLNQLIEPFLIQLEGTVDDLSTEATDEELAFAEDEEEETA